MPIIIITFTQYGSKIDRSHMFHFTFSLFDMIVDLFAFCSSNCIMCAYIWFTTQTTFYIIHDVHIYKPDALKFNYEK